MRLSRKILVSLCLPFFLHCGRSSSLKVSPRPVSDPQGPVTVTCNSALQAVLRVREPSAPKRANEPVRFEIEAKGCTGRFKIEGDGGGQFNAGSVFLWSKTYAQAGPKQEKARVISIDDTGKTVQFVDTNAVDFVVIPAGSDGGGSLPLPTPDPAAPLCQLKRLAPVQYGQPMLFQLDVTGAVTAITFNGQPAQLGSPFPVLPVDGTYVADARIVGPGGIAQCTMGVVVPTCSLKTVKVTPVDATVEISFSGPVQSASSGETDIALPVPPIHQTTFVQAAPNARSQTVQAEVRSPAGDFGKCETTFQAMYRLADIRANFWLPTQPAQLAYDQNLETYWSAGKGPGYYGVWIYLDLGSAVEVSKIRLAPFQSLFGNSRHVISVGTEPIGNGRAGGNGDVVADLARETRDGVFIDANFARRSVRYIHIWTTETPGDTDAGWRELEVYY